MKNNLKHLLRIIRKSKERNIQLDFFRKNGEVILQIYKQKDVSTWSNDINLTDSQGLVLDLYFHENTINNNENFERFKNSIYFERAFKPVNPEYNSYFIGVESSMKLNRVLLIIKDIIINIYEIKDFEYTLKAY